MMAAAMSFQPSMEYQMDGTVNGISKWNPIIDSNIEMCVCGSNTVNLGPKL